MGTVRNKAFLGRSRELSGARVLERPGEERTIVVVGAPLAAARAAALFLVGLPEDFALPIVLALGGSAEDHRDLGVNLQAHSALPVRAIDDKDPLVAGRVHLAPPDYHLFIEDNHFSLSTAEPVKGSRPSLDVLFESVADSYGPAAVCVLLSGEVVGDSDRGDQSSQSNQSNQDGRDGAEKVRARGGLVIVQNPATAVVGSATEPLMSVEGAATVLHLSEIAPFVSRLGDLELS